MGRSHPFSRGRGKQREVVATVECPRRGRLVQGEVHDPLAWSLGGVAGHAGLFGSLFGVYRLTQTWLEAFKGEDTIFILRQFKSFGQGNGYPRILRGHSPGILPPGKARLQETAGRALVWGTLDSLAPPFGST